MYIHDKVAERSDGTTIAIKFRNPSPIQCPGSWFLALSSIIFVLLSLFFYLCSIVFVLLSIFFRLCSFIQYLLSLFFTLSKKMSKSKNKYFVVWDGHEPGIYDSWEECKKQTHGFGQAKYKGFATLEEAREAFCSPCWDYIGKKEKKQDAALIAQKGMPVMESIAVDAACSGNPGPTEYRGVYTRTGEEIFRQGPFRDGSNNIGEFLAIVHALAFLKQKNSLLPIYTDSKTALAWIRAGKARTKIEQTEQNAPLFDLLARAEKWLAGNSYQNAIMKWETEAWGEIPADFGRK